MNGRVEGLCWIGEIWGERKMNFLGDIGIEYGFRIVVMIELEKRVRVERKEEGIM